MSIFEIDGDYLQCIKDEAAVAASFDDFDELYGMINEIDELQELARDSANSETIHDKLEDIRQGLASRAQLIRLKKAGLIVAAV